VLADSFDRAWRRVGLALDRVGFTVEDRDRSKGLYYVRYLDPDIDGKGKSGSRWSRLAFWRSDTGKKDEQFRISVADADKAARSGCRTPMARVRNPQPQGASWRCCRKS